jgi:hypothetical protein
VQKIHDMRALLSVSFVALLALASASQRAAADDGSTTSIRRPSKADELFSRGKERLAVNDYAAACPLLAESYQLDPATGSMLALAICHERQGKLGSALRDYQEVVTRSRAENRPDREQAAQAQILALHSKVSTLTLLIAHKPPDLAIRVNDLPLAKDELGRPLPMDGGFVVIEVEAKDRATWTKHVTLADSGDALTVTIPSLGEAPAALPVLPPPVVHTAPASPKPHKKARFSASEVAGITMMSASAIGAAVAIGYTVKALHKNSESEDKCAGDLCTPAGREARLDARKAGDVATIAVIATTAVASAGLITFLVGRSKRHNDARRDHASVHANGWVAAHSGGAFLAGSF